MTEAAPATENRTLRRLPNAAYRQREYLSEAEVERLIVSVFKCFGTKCGVWNGGSGSFGFEIRQLSTDVAIVAV